MFISNLSIIDRVDTKLVCPHSFVLHFAIRIFCRDHLPSHAGKKDRKKRCHADIEIFTPLISTLYRQIPPNIHLSRITKVYRAKEAVDFKVLIFVHEL